MKIGSLFSGIGGLELGLERAGVGTVAWQVECDPFCLSILAKHWPTTLRYTDVRNFSASSLHVSAPSLPHVEVICGGFPCQDVSVAGAGKGLDGDRSGLWFEYLRIVAELRPLAVVVENVAHGRGRWLPTVRRGLCELGYRTEARLVSARDVGAPHLRDRCFVLAVDAAAHPHRLEVRKRSERQPRRRQDLVQGREEGLPVDPGLARGVARPPAWAPLPHLRGVDDGLPRKLDRRLTDDARNKALGNAVVPQVAEIVGRRLLQLIS